MKRIKAEYLIAAMSIAAMMFMLGFFIGGRDQGTQIITQRINIGSLYEIQQTQDTVQRSVPSSAAAAERINLNTASVEELEGLPGIGEVIAGRIVEYREKNGPFSSVDELDKVEGIGSKRVEAIRDYVTVEETP